MGDEGALYPGVSEETGNYMKKLVGVADIIVPNYTEACYLTETVYSDIFFSILIDYLLNGHRLKESSQWAMDVVRKMIEASLDNEDRFKGIAVESLLGGIVHG